MTEVTVDGVTYRRGEKLDHIPLFGQFICGTLFEPVFRWVGTELQFWCVDHWHINQNLLETLAKGGIYEAIIVEKQPEWREVENRYLNPDGTVIRAINLADDVRKTLKATRIRIHNVDGSVTEYSKDYLYENPVWVYTNVMLCRVTLPVQVMQSDIQLAFMRGSKVEVLNSES